MKVMIEFIHLNIFVSLNGGRAISVLKYFGTGYQLVPKSPYTHLNKCI